MPDDLLATLDYKVISMKSYSIILTRINVKLLIVFHFAFDLIVKCIINQSA